jgi:hypothetical protein
MRKRANKIEAAVKKLRKMLNSLPGITGAWVCSNRAEHKKGKYAVLFEVAQTRIGWTALEMITLASRPVVNVVAWWCLPHASAPHGEMLFAIDGQNTDPGEIADIIEIVISGDNVTPVPTHRKKRPKAKAKFA